MAETDTTVASSTTTPQNPGPPPPGVSREDLERHRATVQRELQELITEAKNADAEEKRKLNEEISELRDKVTAQTEWIDQAKIREDEREKSASTEHTIVTPPAHLSPTQPSPTAPVEPSNAGEPTPEKSKGWKKYW